MAEVALITSAVLGVGAAVQSSRAAKAQNSAQKDAARLERARARAEERRNTRRLVAQARRERAGIVAAANSENQGANSAVSGAIGGLQTSAAAEIGFGRGQLAARTGQSLALQRGASRSTRLQNSAALFQVGSNIASGFAARKRKPSDQQVQPVNPNSVA